ncbi:hypothetical protein V0U79_06060 [Hyphobacterium sp. HN65]|uniref:Uncharacterized protein n=1 Tax=Hyphobacterium lacteum TaxID=3116575 RepID=A0ABU7LPT0_9PROT|nr:hypothetical protein [Hyphobacterium sp. HN65]MEE2525923.1 hypothetical protein [Hyphobacterium sp. HN65]
MILARLTRAFRTQNWFAVTLEFVIVIAGVVIGFQITAWNEARAEQARAESMLARLAVDLEAERWRITATSSYFRDVALEAQEALDAMQGRTDLSDEQLVIKAFRGSQYFWAGVIRSTYEELLASGEINLVPQGQFRDAALEYYNSSESSLLAGLGETPFRDAFRQIVSPALHRHLVANCAEDPDIDIGDYEALSVFLAFPCEIGGFDEEVSALAERLRDDPHLASLLRWRIIEADQNQSNLNYFAQLLDGALADYAAMEATE